MANLKDIKQEKETTIKKISLGVARILLDNPNLNIGNENDGENELIKVGEIIISSKYHNAVDLFRFLIDELGKENILKYLDMNKTQRQLSGGIG